MAGINPKKIGWWFVRNFVKSFVVLILLWIAIMVNLVGLQMGNIIWFFVELFVFLGLVDLVDWILGMFLK